jgi:hypothetical protein
MLIHHLRKSTSGAGGGNSCRPCGCGGKIVAKPHSRKLQGNGLKQLAYDTDLGVIKPTRILQNIKVKKSSIPKKYITFE